VYILLSYPGSAQKGAQLCGCARRVGPLAAQELLCFQWCGAKCACSLIIAREEALMWSMAGAKGLSLIQAIGAPGV
jgi:hypothetical protein